MIESKQGVYLDRAEKGVYTVISLNGGRGMERKLCDLGIYPGAALEVITPSFGFCPIRVAVKGSHFGLGRGMAAKIFVNKNR
jgi:Fe2+ transport system protein FeoA